MQYFESAYRYEVANKIGLHIEGGWQCFFQVQFLYLVFYR